MCATHAVPLVSIGLPVYNGAKTLARSLGSLLEQDYPNLEIIISDNGSIDGTPEICRRYAQGDPRIRYFRSEENRGAIWNFNRVVELAAGAYFMWAAHDDQRDTRFVSSCVAKMEQNPHAVLCQSHTGLYIEGVAEVLSINTLDTFERLHGLVRRYREALNHLPATAIYGLYRLSVMRNMRIFERVIATDVAFIQEISIYGEIVQVPEVLFQYYARAKWNTIDQDYKHFMGKERKPWWYLPFVVLFHNHWQRVMRASLPFSVKLRLCIALLRHEMRRLSIRFLVKTVGWLCPCGWKKRLGSVIYWSLMHNPNVEVVNKDLYRERVIKPMLGW